MNSKKHILKNLESIPHIGKVSAQQLYDIGIRNTDDIKNGDPEAICADLKQLPMTNIDPIMLYVLRCAKYYLITDNPDPEKLQWWYWKDKSNN